MSSELRCRACSGAGDSLSGRVCLIIVAGPQGSGKSTAQRYLAERYSNIVTLIEAARILFDEDRRKGTMLGGALVGSEFEKRIMNLDLERMSKISVEGNRQMIYLDETNIFSVAHESLRDPVFAQRMYENYMKALDSLRVGILFTNVPPDISWVRRRRLYERRYKDMTDFEERIRKSREYLWRIYPEMIKLYERLPFAKRLVHTVGMRSELGPKLVGAFGYLCRELSATPIRRVTMPAR